MRRSSFLARALEPLAGTLWIFFLIWSGLVAMVWCMRLDARALPANPDLARALAWLLHILDPAWITLAAISIYSAIAEAEGLATVRRWSLIVIGGVVAITWSSVRTGYPLGTIHFTEHLGVMLGPVPFGIPLLWLAIILGARECALRLLPSASHNQIALATGVLSLATAFNLEATACHLRWWWIWDAATTHALSSAPLRNYATWLLASAVFAWFMREKSVAGELSRRSWNPIIAFVVMNAVFLLAHAARLAG